MSRVKESQHTGVSSSSRNPTLSTHLKTQKVEKLTSLVQELQQNHVTAQSGNTGERVLDVLKQKIKTNYDTLYKRYPENKNKIIKKIQVIENNLAGENAVKHKNQEVIKEKSKYDKLKATVQEKQKKLKKLKDIKEQLQLDFASHLLKQESKQEGVQARQWQQSQQHYNIWSQMLKQRKQTLLTLQKRYKGLTSAVSDTEQRCDKLKRVNIRRRQKLNTLLQQLQQQLPIQIPAKLSQELNFKLQQYQTHQSYLNILHHESLLEQARQLQQKQKQEQRRSQQKRAKNIKELQQKEQLQELQLEIGEKMLEEEKIKIICGVQRVEDVIMGEYDKGEKERMEIVEKEIQAQIQKIQQQNKALQRQLSQCLSLQQQEGSQGWQSVLQQQQRRFRRLQSELRRRRSQANHWQTLMHLINNNQTDQTSLKQFITSVMEGTLPQISKVIASGRRVGGECNQEESALHEL